jgi:hypothetical protein
MSSLLNKRECEQYEGCSWYGCKCEGFISWCDDATYPVCPDCEPVGCVQA